jgi:hypothetical protein
MATWLLAATDSKASADKTYELAARTGIVWRTFYADRTPRQAVANVRKLAPDDTLYLGYRRPGHTVELLGRMRLGTSEHPLAESQVFTEVPQPLVADFAAQGYHADPILQKMVGLFVYEVEPIEGGFASDNRSTLSGLDVDPFPAPGPQMGRSGPTPRPQAPATRPGTYVGIDVGGDRKGFHLCAVDWNSAAPTTARFAEYPSLPKIAIAIVRPLLAQGRIDDLARETFKQASDVVPALWQQILTLCGGNEPAGVFIDSPSAFSRNTLGHGRLTEKRSVAGVSFQSTPSLAAGNEHRGEWAWLIFGMMGFASCALRGALLSEERWRDALGEGLFRPTLQLPLVVRECFPTLTVATLRRAGRDAEVKALLQPLKLSWPAEVGAVEAYLHHGVRAVKVPRNPLYDRADALVAALSALPHAAPGFLEDQTWPSGGRWSSQVKDAAEIEGAIAVVR